MTTTNLDKPVKKKQVKLKREKSTSNKGHYIDNDDLLATVLHDKQTGVLSDKLARYLFLIAERFSYSPSFVGYSFRKDMVAAAVLNLVCNWHKFNEEVSSNPFSFYTTAVYRSFLNFLALEKEERDIRDKLLADQGANPSFSYQDSGDDSYD